MLKTTIDRAPARRTTQLPRFFRWFSEHCVLRPLDASDVVRIWQAVTHPAFERCWTTAIPHSAAEVAALVRSAQSDWLRGRRYLLAVTRKHTREFVGWIELRAGAAQGTWTLDWFIHPRFVADELAREAVSATADLLFSVLDAQAVFANCPAHHAPFERLLNDAGFIELVPAGSLDKATGRPRRYALFEMQRADWEAVCRALHPDRGPATLNSAFRESALELALL
jgi:RimJ/RimL family protein N-acetyltransferase